MSEFDLAYWHWWVAAVVLVILETFAPGAVLIWFGAAAAVVGLVLFLLPDTPWELQLLLFTVLSIASVVAWRVYQKKRPEENAYPVLNRRGEQYLGRMFTLEEPIVNAVGKVRVDDSTWKIRGPDLEAGARVKVASVDGTVLIVEPAD